MSGIAFPALFVARDARTFWRMKKSTSDSPLSRRRLLGIGVAAIPALALAGVVGTDPAAGAVAHPTAMACFC
jgi:hypothetical protein